MAATAEKRNEPEQFQPRPELTTSPRINYNINDDSSRGQTQKHRQSNNNYIHNQNKL